MSGAVEGLAEIVEVAAGCHFNLALRSDGTVRARGSNAKGELEVGSTTSYSASPIQISGLSQLGDGSAPLTPVKVKTP